MPSAECCYPGTMFKPRCIYMIGCKRVSLYVGIRKYSSEYLSYA